MRRAKGVGVALSVLVPVLVACAPRDSARTEPSIAVVAGAIGPGADRVDRWGVFVCAVPADDVNPPFAATDIRVDLDPETLVERLAPVTDYFDRWSHGRARIEFVVGDTVAIASDEGPTECVDAALARATDDVNGVVVVADAQHDPSDPGGWGRTGEPCELPCPARRSGRAVYLGASDFTPFWADSPPLDLVEHEIGHALGWPHSAITIGDRDRHVYDSPYDVMSDGAAPRRLDEARRHGPGVLAVNQLHSGWIDAAAVVEFDYEALAVGEWQDAIVLASTDSDTGVRLIAVALPDGDYLTIELVADRGDDDHLPESGVIVHRVDRRDSESVHRLLVSANDGVALIDGEGRGEFEDPWLSVGVERITSGPDGERVDVRIRRTAPDTVRRDD